MEQGNYCWEHDIAFKSEQEYNTHAEAECDNLLATPNVCIHLNADGKCCGKHYKHISTLILHYRTVHKEYACVHCYQTYTTKKGFERHKHEEGISFRQSK